MERTMPNYSIASTTATFIPFNRYMLNLISIKQQPQVKAIFKAEIYIDNVVGSTGLLAQFKKALQKLADTQNNKHVVTGIDRPYFCANPSKMKGPIIVFPILRISPSNNDGLKSEVWQKSIVINKEGEVEGEYHLCGDSTCRIIIALKGGPQVIDYNHFQFPVTVNRNILVQHGKSEKQDENPKIRSLVIEPSNEYIRQLAQDLKGKVDGLGISRERGQPDYDFSPEPPDLPPSDFNTIIEKERLRLADTASKRTRKKNNDYLRNLNPVSNSSTLLFSKHADNMLISLAEENYEQHRLSHKQNKPLTQHRNVLQ